MYAQVCVPKVQYYDPYKLKKCMDFALLDRLILMYLFNIQTDKITLQNCILCNALNENNGFQ